MILLLKEPNPDPDDDDDDFEGPPRDNWPKFILKPEDFFIAFAVFVLNVRCLALVALNRTFALIMRNYEIEL